MSAEDTESTLKITCSCNKELNDQNTIGNIIDCLLHRVLDIEECANAFIESAREKYNANAERLRTGVTQCVEAITGDNDREQQLIVIRDLRKHEREIDRHNNSSPARTLEISLFISLFAAFDKYIGDLVSVLYESNPNLYKNINKEVLLSEVLTYQSIDDLRQVMLTEEIETLRRKSYIEQFADLEKRFSITLTKFDDWPDFIESAQRRNLFTHCDGIVSKQYLKICKYVNYSFKNKPSVGDQLHIGETYFFKVCQILSSVGVMLGQTLWRKVLPDDIGSADDHLRNTIFDFLNAEQWDKAINLSKFALNLPKISNEETERIFIVNYAIALKAIDNGSAARHVLDKKDWSATSYDFKIAYAVLNDDYEEASGLMLKMGPEGELIGELAYHDWPLFNEFRSQQDFFDSYEEIYGYKYCQKLTSIAENKREVVVQTEEHAEK